jgi:hypothetical protein
MTRVMAAHQPNFLPYLGFFDKLKRVEDMGSSPGMFVIRDDCQYVQRDFHHRNRIRTNTGDGWMWLYVPVEHEMIPIREVKIRHDKKIAGREYWTKYHLRMIWDNYRRAPFFDKYYQGFVEIYSSPGDNLCDFNIRLIKYIAQCFGIKTKMISFYDLALPMNGSEASETLANIARAVGADVYLSGDGGKGYLEMAPFSNSVRVEFQNYEHPVYPQRYPGFKPYMSAIDALFNTGRIPLSGEQLPCRVREQEVIECSN